MNSPATTEVKSEPEAPVDLPTIEPDSGGSPAAEPKSAEPEKQPKKFKKWKFSPQIMLLAAIIIVLAIAGGTGAYFYHRDNVKKTVKHTNTTSVYKFSSKTSRSTKASPNIPAGTLTKLEFTSNVTYLTGVNYYSTPKLLPTDLNFFADTADEFGVFCNTPANTDCTPYVLASDINYYQIGTTAANQPIIIASDYPLVEMLGGASFYYIAIETSNNKYAILARMEDEFTSGTVAQQEDTLTTFAKYLSPNVTLDTGTALSDIAFPASTTIQNMPLSRDALRISTYSANSWFMPTLNGSPVPAMTSLGQQGNLTFYEVTAEDSDNYQVKEIYATFKQLFANYYTVNDSLNSTSTAPKITWSDGSVNRAKYSSVCIPVSSENYMIAKNITPDQLKVVGTGPQNQTIYGLDSSSALFNEIYSDYDGGPYLLPPSLQNLSAMQFQSDHGFFLAQNSLGEYVIYVNTDLIIGGVCG